MTQEDTTIPYGPFLEEWKPVVNYEGLYEVSNYGRVKSFKYDKERILKSGLNSGGYLSVNLYKNGNSKTINVHQLVAEAFLSHVNFGNNIEIDHIDNNPLNNSLYNLQTITRRLNLSKDKKGSSKYTGVSWYKANKKWASRIHINGKRKHLGYFINEIDAHLAYQKALK